MFGLVNKGIEEMVCNQFGEDIWENIKEKADVDVVTFISMDSYPDEITYRLVDAASEVLDISTTDVLEAFGQYWVLFTAAEGYEELMAITGDNLPEFLQNLDNLHGRVGLSFPNLQMPSFQCSELQAESLNLHYYSERPGLTPLVIGILKGLGKRFKSDVDIQHVSGKSDGKDYEQLAILHKSKCPFSGLLKRM
jgi:hypothetical protein